MKQILLALLLILVSGEFNYAQTPESFSYQTVVRNGQSQVVTNQNIGIKISLLKGSANGEEVYEEEHNMTTSDNGVISLMVGKGSVIPGSFSGIEWGNGPFFIQIGLDETGEHGLVCAKQDQSTGVR